MKKVVLSTLALAAGLLLVNTACKKKSDDPAPDKTVSITGASWKKTAIKMEGSGGGQSGSQDVPLDDCEKVTVYKFAKDGSATFTGNTSCPTGTTKWEFNKNQDSLFIGSGEDKDGYRIESIDASTIRLSQGTSMSGVTMKYIDTYSAVK